MIPDMVVRTKGSQDTPKVSEVVKEKQKVYLCCIALVKFQCQMDCQSNIFRKVITCSICIILHVCLATVSVSDTWISTIIILHFPHSAAVFTVMCYNVLCDKYATRQLYGYCPSWALNWEYRKKGIMEEITSCDADIISLQVNERPLSLKLTSPPCFPCYISDLKQIFLWPG